MHHLEMLLTPSYKQQQGTWAVSSAVGILFIPLSSIYTTTSHRTSTSVDMLAPYTHHLTRSEAEQWNYWFTSESPEPNSK